MHRLVQPVQEPVRLFAFARSDEEPCEIDEGFQGVARFLRVKRLGTQVGVGVPPAQFAGQVGHTAVAGDEGCPVECGSSTARSVAFSALPGQEANLLDPVTERQALGARARNQGEPLRYPAGLHVTSLPLDDHAVESVVQGEAARPVCRGLTVTGLDLERYVAAAELLVPDLGLRGYARCELLCLGTVADDAKFVQGGAVRGLLGGGAAGEVGERAALEGGRELGYGDTTTP